MSKREVRIGLLGLGTVGCGTLAVLHRNAAQIERRAGVRFRVVAAAVRDPAKPRDIDTETVRLTDDAATLVADPEVDIIVELIGGESPARELVLAALANGKPVVTANKALIAQHGEEILAAAHRANLSVAFEAAVAGGVPIVKSLREAMAGNRINRIAGIINGTGNYILTAMEQHGADFGAVLAEAQRLGYAEADPTFDVEGIDAAHKLTILAAISFGVPLNFEAVYTEGITAIQQADIVYAAELGYRIKHLGIAAQTTDGLSVRVHPTLIPQETPLANVDGVMNAVLVEADAAGHTLFYGPGAGAEPTASAVIADLVDTARTLGTDATARVPSLAFHPDDADTPPLLPMDEIRTAYYLRLQAQDRPGVLADIARVLGDAEISIEAIQQKEPAEAARAVDVIMVTRQVREGAMREALVRIEALEAVSGPVVRIRLNHLGD